MPRQVDQRLPNCYVKMAAEKVRSFDNSFLTKKRYHDLDALRAFAMLLGIVLHGFMSFVLFPIPQVWPTQDINQHEGYLFALHAIHGFRMQLFFLVSGFFTAMMFRQRGIRGLIKHRAKRVLLPLIIFGIILIPTIIGITVYALKANRVGNETIWMAAKSGDVEAINRHLIEGANLNQPDPIGSSPGSYFAGSLPFHGLRYLVKLKPPRRSLSTARTWRPGTTMAQPRSTMPRSWAKWQWPSCWSKTEPTSTQPVTTATLRFQ